MSAALDTAETDEAEKPAQAGGREGVQHTVQKLAVLVSIQDRFAGCTWYMVERKLPTYFKV